MLSSGQKDRQGKRCVGQSVLAAADDVHALTDPVGIALRQPADQRRQPRRACVGLVDVAAEPALQARGVGGLQEGLGAGTPGTKPAGPASGRRRPGGLGRRGPPRPWRLRWACRTERRAPAAPAPAPARRPGPGAPSRARRRPRWRPPRGAAPVAEVQLGHPPLEHLRVFGILVDDAVAALGRSNAPGVAPTADLTVNSLTATSFVQTPLLQSAAADLQIRNATTTLRAEDGTLLASFAAGSIGLEQDITVRSDRTLNATTADFAQFFVGSTAATGAFTSSSSITATQQIESDLRVQAPLLHCDPAAQRADRHRRDPGRAGGRHPAGERSDSSGCEFALPEPDGGQQRRAGAEPPAGANRRGAQLTAPRG